MRLDEIDQSILSILQNEGRISNRRLASRVAISESACRERVRRLERQNLILGYRAVLSPNFSPDLFDAWATISLTDAPCSVVTAVEGVLCDTKEVLSCYTMTGAYDLVIRFMAGNQSRWDAFCLTLETIGVGRDRIKFGIITARRGRQ